jgi:cell division septation protein DedD
MTGIDRYISELLFDHDCVILPGVGGFLTNYSGARIHPIRHSFQPASRTLVFNANLRTNDGLLIDYVSRNESISYQEASVKVNDYAMGIIREMEEGNTVVLEHIGTCHMGREKNIIFQPDESSNFLADAFGLPSFVSPAIKRETVRQRLEKQLTPTPSAPREEKKRKLQPAAGWAAILAVPITAALLLYMFNPTIIDGPGKSFATFVPALSFNKAKPISVETESADFTKFRVIPDDPEAISQQPEASIQDPDIPQPHTSSPAPVLTKYQIVVGAFSRVSNAEKYVAKLRGKNYDASIVGESRSGLTRVAINGSNNKQEAIGMMNAIRKSENPSAWLLRIR